MTRDWHYLVVTAASAAQAAAYESQLRLRQRLGLLPGVREVLVVPDPGGRRVGSGGSTIHCLLKILGAGGTAGEWRRQLDRLRILIVHAGGDSRRLPPYGPAGKVFVPIPGEGEGLLPRALLDRILPLYLALPPAAPDRGQVVVTTGDVLLSFDPGRIRIALRGITGLGCTVHPDLASHHGVFCPDKEGRVRFFLQKPSPAMQREKKALDRSGRATLDIGVMSLDAESAVRLLKLVNPVADGKGGVVWRGAMAKAILEHGLDFYRDVCCALGSETTWPQYLQAVRDSGSRLPGPILRRLFHSLEGLPFFVVIVPQCGFLHFGRLRQLISSGNDLLSIEGGLSHHGACLSINNLFTEKGQISGSESWVEGCRIQAPLRLGGGNVATGLDIDRPLELPRGACLDVLAARRRKGRAAWFVRVYGVDDRFTAPFPGEAVFCQRRLAEWLALMEAEPGDIWDRLLPPRERCVWNARLFPEISHPLHYRRWTWMYDPGAASSRLRRSWREARRHSFADMAGRVDLEAFHRRRRENRAAMLRRSPRDLFRLQSDFSAAELALLLEDLSTAERLDWLRRLLDEASTQPGGDAFVPALQQLEFSRILHSTGAALQILAGGRRVRRGDSYRRIWRALGKSSREELAKAGLHAGSFSSLEHLAQGAKDAALAHVGRVIVRSSVPKKQIPGSALRSDEIVWARSPVRFDLGGGWSDTPPYCLEHGGCVINAAVDLNGQPPIHVYARLIAEQEIHLVSIDHGSRSVIHSLRELLDYRDPVSKFALAKAALALSGFNLEADAWPRRVRSLADMMRAFGGGIELTTLAAVPSGSGLGSSSIMGAALIAAIHRMLGREPSQRELFHLVLQLEQELTTGGGWQDQIGGAEGGVKIIRTKPGLVPDPAISFVPADVLDPGRNGGLTLLYYTGQRRLAKNILRHVVGNYLDRDRAALATLRRIHAFPEFLAEAMAAKDSERFGRLLSEGWELKKRIDPESTTKMIEEILAAARPHIHGATVLGAGGGGFILLVCRSAAHAAAVRGMLGKDPPNERARFFDFRVNDQGMAVTVC